MKLYIKQKVFSWNDKFTVKDENGNDRYFIESEIFSIGKKLHIYDVNGNEVAFISQRLLTFMPKFEVYAGGEFIAEIVKQFTFFRPSYAIEGLNWQIDGDFFDHDYVITENGAEIASVSKEWFTWGDSYALDISDEADHIMALAVIIAIDCVNAQANNHNTSN